MTIRSSGFGFVLAAALLGHAWHAHGAPPDATSGTKEPTAADRERSRAAFRKGVAQLRVQDWRGARVSFEEAWTLVQHPSILLNLGIARLRTDDPVLAEQDLVRFLSDDPGAQPDEITGAREALAEARAKIGTLRVTTSASVARITIDAKTVAVRAPDAEAGGGLAEARLKAGMHVVTVEAEGFTPEQREVEVPAKSEVALRVALVAKANDAMPASAAPPTSSLRTIAGFSLAGLGGVAIVASGVLALEALGLSHDYEDPASKSFQRPDVKSEGIAFRTGADLALLAGLFAGAGAVILLFTDLGASSRAGVAPRTSSAVGLRVRWAQPLTLRW